MPLTQLERIATDFDFGRINEEQKRKQYSDIIFNSPESFKICDGCETIVPRETIECHCKSMQFLTHTRQSVMVKARELGGQTRQSFISDDLN